MAKVYIANYQEKDFSPAEKFGELIFVTQGFVPLQNLGKVRSMIKGYLEFSSQHDYLILNGPSVIVHLISVLWFNKHGYSNILSWDGKSKSYKHFVVGVDSVEEKLGSS